MAPGLSGSLQLVTVGGREATAASIPAFVENGAAGVSWVVDD